MQIISKIDGKITKVKLLENISKKLLKNLEKIENFKNNLSTKSFSEQSILNTLKSIKPINMHIRFIKKSSNRPDLINLSRLFIAELVDLTIQTLNC